MYNLQFRRLYREKESLLEHDNSRSGEIYMGHGTKKNEKTVVKKNNVDIHF